jgi:hypothetical protein
MREALVAAWLLAAGLDVASGSGEAAAGQPLHTDKAVVAEAYLAAATAFVHDDLAAAKEALARIAGATRRLMPEESARFGSGIVDYDRAFHATLNATRSFLNQGDGKQAFEQFYYVQMGCRVCHGLARERGLVGPQPSRK